MAKQKKKYCCNSCGFVSPQWLGKCSQCGMWNSFEEQLLVENVTKRGKQTSVVKTKDAIVPLSNITSSQGDRMSVGSKELNRVLGGGVYPGTTVLFAGEPGIGKSTLLLQVSSSVADSGDAPVLYVTAEESVNQIRTRAERLGIVGENIYVIAESNMDVICKTMDELKPSLVIVDSIQAVNIPEIASAPGTVTQVRESAFLLCERAKEIGAVLFLIGHVTKEGMLAGPRLLEHLVDTVLYFEGDRYEALRLVRSVKNRFGSTGEIGIYEMAHEGLREVDNPSSTFLSEIDQASPGRVTVAVMEGRRPFLVEVQSLTNKSSYNNPLRRSLGVEVNKISLLIAVIERSLDLSFFNHDVFVKIVGGLKLREAGADIAVAMAIISSFKMVAIPSDVVMVGELGLGGEVRKVRFLEERIKEAARLGFRKIIIPQNSSKKLPKVAIEITEVGHLTELYSTFVATHA